MNIHRISGLAIVLLVGCGNGSTGSTTGGGDECSANPPVPCTEGSACPAGTVCNTGMAEPECQQIRCLPKGSPCAAGLCGSGTVCEGSPDAQITCPNTNTCLALGTAQNGDTCECNSQCASGNCVYKSSSSSGQKNNCAP